VQGRRAGRLLNAFVNVMQRFRVILFGALLAMAGCHSDKLVIPIPPPAMTATGYISFARVNKRPSRAPVSQVKTEEPSPEGSSNQDSSAKGKILSAIKVPDQPGYVRSPYNPDAGMIDVRGMPSGAEIYDPYSGNTILVP
jgi:hypothetical protein